MAAATIGVGMCSPSYFKAAFNRVSLNAAVAALAVVDLLNLAGVPSASRYSIIQNSNRIRVPHTSMLRAGFLTLLSPTYKSLYTIAARTATADAANVGIVVDNAAAKSTYPTRKNR